MKKGIGKFLLASAVVLVIVVAADWALGKAVDRMLPAISNQGQIGCTYFALNEVEYPVLVVGSSRATHHYVPSIMKDSLGMEVYNIGRDGCFFSYNCCVIQSISDRYTPEMIVWETSMDALSSDNDPLESLYPYYGKNRFVTECVNSVCDWTERVPLVSNLYKYNSNLIRIASRYAQRGGYVEDGLNGYIPLPPKNWTPAERKSSVKDEVEVVDETKVLRFRSVLEMAVQKGIRIVVVNSPSFMASGKVSESEKKMCGICDSMGVPILNFAQAEGIYDDIQYWCDYIHMNKTGAEMYTKMFLEGISGKGE